MLLYYDCFAGISGDMNLGALIDLGVDENYLKKELDKLNITGFRLNVKRDKRRGISGTKVEVTVENPENEKHRHLRHVEEIISASTLSDKVKADSLKIFNLVAEAEAKVHAIPKESVHFHEVGALDSIADIVGAAICLDYLKAGRIISSPVQLGGGTVRCAHGVMPVPAPATAEILKNIPVRSGLVNHEATTPTGAAIIAAMAGEFVETCSFRIVKTAYGIGSRDTEVPNVLRIFLCDDEEPDGAEPKNAGPECAEPKDVTAGNAVIIECNIDDMTPERYEFILDKLFGSGASDAWLTPVIMKKSRPAVMLSVLCDKQLSAQIKDVIFRYSTTIGLREYSVKKNMLRREQFEINTIYGKVRIKQSFYDGRPAGWKAEFEDCRRLAEKHNVGVAEIEKAVFTEINKIDIKQ